ncbi:MAG TPA: decaprenyl-phosphate phosphoribosyltransferase [Chthonomonadaceae bacterium]|nr:decaprenyl-phosphate phosphoribosyltransferase [Chthonomonadaceae bacterium]
MDLNETRTARPEERSERTPGDARDRAGAHTVSSLLKALVIALRPKQATKNLFVYAALVFAGKLFDLTQLARVTVAFLLFTLVTGSVYLFNDLQDVEQDRLHPKKRYRPIASGRLPAGLAWAALILLALFGVGCSFLLSIPFGVVVVVYLALQIAYCLGIKQIVLLDVFAIAAGFVLRAVAGGAVIHVGISHWLLLCTLQLALFLGFGKRRQELVLLGAGAGSHRAILEEYSLPFLDQMITIVAGVTIVCYSVYSVESATAHLHPHLWITVPFVIFGVCRYLYLVYQKGWGGAPDEVLLKDRTLQATLVLWFLVVMLLFVFDLGSHAFLGWQ